MKLTLIETTFTNYRRESWSIGNNHGPFPLVGYVPFTDIKKELTVETNGHKISADHFQERLAVARQCRCGQCLCCQTLKLLFQS